MISRDLLPEGATCRCGAPITWNTHIVDDDTGATWGLLFTCDEHKGGRCLSVERMGRRVIVEEVHIKIGPMKEVA